MSVAKGDIPMTLLDFTIEFQTATPELIEDLRTEAEVRLRDLAAGHNDLTGAAVAVTERLRKLSELANDPTRDQYQERSR
jgi:hypothetical protein